jgi:hypothetical protein
MPSSDELKALLASRVNCTVLTPDDGAEYDEKIKRWASNAEKRAAFIVLVESPEDISKTVWTPPTPLFVLVMGGFGVLMVDSVCYGEGIGFGYQGGRTFCFGGFVYGRWCRRY